jgi:hypothetical protein
MAKKQKRADELIALLNAELRKHKFCQGISVNEIVRVKDERLHFTWTALIREAAGTPEHGDCSRFFLAALQLLQQAYDLRPDE